ncbi:MAG: sialate O-acetylesterase [Bacteroidales bacterium]|nr:sialate O-acetylesterase [Candidatus Cryptobacteroides aphodequi]
MMMKKWLFACVALLLAACTTPDDGLAKKPEGIQKKYDVFLLIGQSNMAGRGTLLPEDYETTLKDVYLLDDKGEIVPATHPYNQYSSVRKELELQQMNPGFGFAAELRRHTNRPILIVCNAKGGTSLSEWKSGSRLFSEAVRRCRQACEYGDLKAILWHQGESDVDNCSTYMENLLTFVTALRSELRCGKCPFIAGEIAQWHRGAPVFNPMIQLISDTIPYSDWVSSEGCTDLKGTSDPHFSREGQILLGSRYGKKVAELCY